jgi:hypothetical protein
VSGLQWFKSSYSANNGSCVEVAMTPDAVMARDSKNPEAGQLSFPSASWVSFLRTTR